MYPRDAQFINWSQELSTFYDISLFTNLMKRTNWILSHSTESSNWESHQIILIKREVRSSGCRMDDISGC